MVLALLVSGCSSGTPPVAPGIQSIVQHAVSHDLLVKIATAGKQPIYLPKGVTGSFVVFVKDASAPDRNVTLRFELKGLPVDATICETTTNGQCQAAPKPSVEVTRIGHAQDLTFAAFLIAKGSISLGTVVVQFVENGEVIGSGKVTVTTKS